ncbi:MAG: hypothetical protein KME42_28510 [Tildeniella nuda ZEHNDER 1965/U140]|jgi:hypothetical protein|nr:hypothetical protein [Tildeniella nuda ZEHNDER 1965/U140]
MPGVENGIGIDVCKRWLNVHLRPQNQSFRVRNRASGITELVHQLSLPEQVGRVV